MTVLVKALVSRRRVSVKPNSNVTSHIENVKSLIIPKLKSVSSSNSSCYNCSLFLSDKSSLTALPKRSRSSFKTWLTILCKVVYLGLRIFFSRKTFNNSITINWGLVSRRSMIDASPYNKDSYSFDHRLYLKCLAMALHWRFMWPNRKLSQKHFVIMTSASLRVIDCHFY